MVVECLERTFTGSDEISHIVKADADGYDDPDDASGNDENTNASTVDHEEIGSENSVNVPRILSITGIWTNFGAERYCTGSESPFYSKFAPRDPEKELCCCILRKTLSTSSTFVLLNLTMNPAIQLVFGDGSEG